MTNFDLHAGGGWIIEARKTGRICSRLIGGRLFNLSDSKLKPKFYIAVVSSQLLGRQEHTTGGKWQHVVIA